MNKYNAGFLIVTVVTGVKFNVKEWFRPKKLLGNHKKRSDCKITYLHMYRFEGELM